MKVYKLLAIQVFAFLLLSCTKKGPLASSFSKNDTIQNEVEKKVNTLEWTTEIEKTLLKKKVDKSDFVSDSLPLSPSVMTCIASDSIVVPIFPELEGFANLDISDIAEDSKKVIDSFCLSVINNTIDETLFEKENLYTLVLFLYDVQNYSPMLSYRIGKPFISDSVFQVPVRFCSKKETMDVFVYLVQNEEGSKIDQIQIQKVGDINGN